MNNIYQTINNEIWTPFTILNGRINMYENNRNANQILNNNKELNNENNLNTISRTYTETSVSIVYFSKNNIDIIQQAIIESVYSRSNGLYKIKRQSDQELTIIMRSFYFQYGKNSLNDISGQVKELNNMVIDWSVKEIIKNIKQYDSYKESVSTLPMPLERSQLPSQKGTRTLEIKSFI